MFKAEPDTGRIRVAGGVLRMDASSSLRGKRLNDATLHVNLLRASEVRLSFQHRHTGDEHDPMPGTFSGFADADGVAFSSDGIDWHKLTDFSGEPTNTWRTFEFDLDRAVAEAGISYTENFRIRFQQSMTTVSVTTDGIRQRIPEHPRSGHLRHGAGSP